MHFILAQHVLIVNSDLRQHTRPAETCFVNGLMDRVKTNVVEAKDGRGIIWTINKQTESRFHELDRIVETKKSTSLPIFPATFRYYPTIWTNVVINRWNFHATPWHNESHLRTEETEFHSSSRIADIIPFVLRFYHLNIIYFITQRLKMLCSIIYLFYLVSPFWLYHNIYYCIHCCITRYSRNFRHILEILQSTGTRLLDWKE